MAQNAVPSTEALDHLVVPKRQTDVVGIISRVFFWILIVVLMFYTLFPFYWAIVSSLKPNNEIFATPATYWPRNIDFSHYQFVLSNGKFLQALRNSIIVSVGTTLLALLFGATGAYALGRLKFRGRTAALYLILAMTMFPAVAILGSLFQMVRGDWFLHTPNLYNTKTALVITYLTFALPFTVWVLTNFFKAMPGELEEAALVDGATNFRAFWEILLPLAMPGLVTTGLLAFIGAWNEYLYALTFTTDYRAKTVQVAIAQFSGNTEYELPFANKMAASVIVTVPLIALVLIFQRKILAGLTSGAVKG